MLLLAFRKHIERIPLRKFHMLTQRVCQAFCATKLNWYEVIVLNRIRITQGSLRDLSHTRVLSSEMVQKGARTVDKRVLSNLARPYRGLQRSHGWQGNLIQITVSDDYKSHWESSSHYGSKGLMSRKEKAKYPAQCDYHGGGSQRVACHILSKVNGYCRCSDRFHLSLDSSRARDIF